jgi:hypothetical protein
MLINSGLLKTNMFSNVANPRADIIIYKGISIGSSIQECFKAPYLTTMYFNNSSVKPIIKIYLMIM